MRRQFYWIVGAVCVVVVVAVAVVLVLGPVWIHRPLSKADLNGVADAEKRIALQQAQAQLQNDARSTLLQCLGGLILVIGAAATWRQVQVSRHGQITERITRAVDQLASQSIDVRLGGLYALQRVAKNSYEDRATVMAILTAFVRSHAPWPNGSPNDHQHSAPALDDNMPRLGLRAEDVQTALYILATRPRSRDDGPLYLSFTDLRIAGMSNRGWRDLICKNANLAGAWLENAHLDRAHLQGTDLRQARLVACRLIDAKLVGAHLQKALLHGADLRGADLTDACLDGADLTDVRTDERTKWPEGFDLATHNQPSS